MADVPRMIKNASKGHVDAGSDPLFEALTDILHTLKDTSDALTGKKVEDRWVQHGANTVGYLSKFPTKPVGKGGQYLWNINKGGEDTEPPEIMELLRGLVFGPKHKPETKKAEFD